jgi:predicted transglutaminase-like cysteine proteinase
MPEFWTEATEEGSDCEDFAIAKMQRLKAMGLPISQMRLATCFVERSAGPEKKDRYHAVLLVDMDTVGMNSQTYVLDNRHPYPMEYDMLPYEWHKLQVAGAQTWEWAVGADKSIR